MDERKTFVRFFTIADFKEEEIWLRAQHKKGWRLLKMRPPCFYTFEKCAPEDVTYRLDFKNGEETGSYYQMFRDYGWDYIGQSLGWVYFRKADAEMVADADGEIFSDNQSRMDLIRRVIKRRLLPVLIVFLCCVIPNLGHCMRMDEDSWAGFFAVFFSAMAVLYIWLIAHCGLKLRKMGEDYKNE